MRLAQACIAARARCLPGEIPRVLKDGSLAASSAVRHGFFTRLGGVSSGAYDSLNCGLGSADEPARVHENRARAMKRLGLPPEALVTARQVHSDRAQVVEEAWAGFDRPELDGLATRTRGLALGILTADCAPVLLADVEAGVIGAAHAGWRGARTGVLEATVSAMTSLGARPASIVAAVGPCISRDSYEVGQDFRDLFVRDEPASATLFTASPSGRLLFDLPGYVVERLRALRLAEVTVSARDTCAEANLFFSYRRVTLNGGGDYGRQLSAIALLP